MVAGRKHLPGPAGAEGERQRRQRLVLAATDIGGLMTVAGHRREAPLATWSRSGPNFLLNCPPNRDGLLPAGIVTLLRNVGAAWTPNASRPPLPAQGPRSGRRVHTTDGHGRHRRRERRNRRQERHRLHQHVEAHRRAAAVDHAGSRARCSPTSAAGRRAATTASRRGGERRQRSRSYRHPREHRRRRRFTGGDVRDVAPRIGKMKVATFGPRRRALRRAWRRAPPAAAARAGGDRDHGRREAARQVSELARRRRAPLGSRSLPLEQVKDSVWSRSW